MHPTVKKFSMSGEILDSDVLRQRDLLDHVMLDQMRELGYVPVLGFGPLFTTEYNFERDVLMFDISYYGVKVGKKSWEIEGMDLSGRMLSRTPPNKSEQSSEESES